MIMLVGGNGRGLTCLKSARTYLGFCFGDLNSFLILPRCAPSRQRVKIKQMLESLEQAQEQLKEALKEIEAVEEAEVDVRQL